ncbi:transposase [Streptomyces sp. NPDC048430]|uniref:transposase n=1 Tax=Streptomyces sp. NPDC048430 TaxID=3155388 RepID=UPI00342BB807
MAGVGHRRSGGLLDNVAGWGLTAPVVVADAGYGVSTPFRHGAFRNGACPTCSR